MASIGRTESEWQIVAELQTHSRAVAVVDPMSWDGVHVELEPGVYVVRIRTVQYEEDSGPRVSRVQLIKKKSGSVVLGETIGEVGVDAATVGILDAKALDPEMANETAEFEEELSGSWQSGEESGVVKWGPGDDDEMGACDDGVRGWELHDSRAASRRGTGGV